MTAPETDRTPDTEYGPDGTSAHVTARQAAALTGLNERTVRRAIARGDLPAIKRRGVFGIEVAALQAWRERRATGAASAPPAGLARREAQPGTALPEPVTSLIGRERELAVATGILRREGVRLLTLTGAGGIGKTRLSLAAAARLRADFADGVHMVPLADVSDGALVAARIARCLGLPEPGGEDGREALLAALRDLRALLVLDNFEHVLEAAPVVSELLGACPHLKVMVTSRALLRVKGEHALPVPPLELPATAVDAPAEQEASPAVRLFVERAQAVVPSFALTAANAPVVIAICHRLAGLPLAIELAASQVTVLPPDALLARIEAHLPLPAGGPRDAPDRQRTMTNAIAWSYTLLSPDERRVFRRLGVFAGGFSLDAAEAVGGAIDGTRAAGLDPTGDDALAHLAALVDASLVQRAGADDALFTMLEPIRAFALDQLSFEGEVDATCDALADWCLALAERSRMATIVPGGERHLARLELAHANIHQALQWLHQRRDGDRLLRLAVALGGYWYERNHYREASAWTERALAASVQADLPTRAQAMVQLGLFLGILGDLARARALADEGVALLDRGGDIGALALAHIWQGAISVRLGAYDLAGQAFSEALRLATTMPDASLAAPIAARAKSNLGLTAHARGDFAGATRWHEQALRTCREHGYLLGVVRASCDLADVARDRGDYRTALASYRASLSVLGEQSDLRVVIAGLQGAALAATSWEQGARAARLLGAAAGLEEAFGVPTFLPSDRTAHERAMQRARAMVGSRRFDELFASGRRLTRAEAIAEVLASAPPAGGERALHPSGGSLSRREREVLRLLAAGHRDREIAERLFISVRTVEGHVTRILAKLNVPTRVAAARAAIDLGLGDPDR